MGIGIGTDIGRTTSVSPDSQMTGGSIVHTCELGAKETDSRAKGAETGLDLTHLEHYLWKGH
jgi:hypothetical protein